jgi:hypothetical protein
MTRKIGKVVKHIAEPGCAVDWHGVYNEGSSPDEMTDRTRRMWIGVIVVALEDCAGFHMGENFGYRRNYQKIKDEAYEWFMSTEVGEGSFIWITENLELQKSRTRFVKLAEELYNTETISAKLLLRIRDARTHLVPIRCARKAYTRQQHVSMEENAAGIYSRSTQPQRLLEFLSSEQLSMAQAIGKKEWSGAGALTHVAAISSPGLWGKRKIRKVVSRTSRTQGATSSSSCGTV